KPDFKVAGPTLGSKVKLLGKALAQADTDAIVDELENQGKVTLDVDGEDLEITKDFVEIRISSKEGFNVQMINNVFVILDTAINDDLKSEGYAREIISKIQQI